MAGSERRVSARRSVGPPPTPSPRGGSSPCAPPTPRVLEEIAAPPENVGERKTEPRRSPRLCSQKENIPAPPPPPPPSPPLPSSAPPRVRRSYSRLSAPPPPLGTPPQNSDPPILGLSPIVAPPPLTAPPLPAIGAGPERKKKKRAAPIDAQELEAWAARMNAQFEEAERFHLVVE